MKLKPRLEPTERELQMGEMRQTMTLQQIATHFGVSRERIRQILTKQDLDRPPDKRGQTICRFCGAVVFGPNQAAHRADHTAIERQLMGSGLTVEQEMRHEAITEMYLAGERIDDISRTFRVNGRPMCYSQIYRILRLRGIVPNRKAGSYPRTELVLQRLKESQRLRRLHGPDYPGRIERGWRAND